MTAIRTHSILDIFLAIMPLDYYVCETWSLNLRKERRPRALNKRELRKILGHKRDELTREWKKLPNEELNELYCSQNVIWVTKLRGVWWAGHVERSVRGDAYTEVWCCILMETDKLEDPGVDVKIILRWIYSKWDVGMDWIEVAQDRYRQQTRRYLHQM
jgi:hypothetical protein